MQRTRVHFEEIFVFDLELLLSTDISKITVALVVILSNGWALRWPIKVSQPRLRETRIAQDFDYGISVEHQERLEISID
jgi:hypothetical protein